MIRITLLILAVGTMLCSPAQADWVLPVEGEVNFETGEFQTRVAWGERSSVVISGKPQSSEAYYFVTDLQHVGLGRSVLSTHLDSIITRIPATDVSGAIFRGKVNSQYSLFNFRPALEWTGHFEIDAQRLRIQSVRLGPTELTGEVLIQWPFPYMAQFLFSSIDLDAFMGLWLQEKKNDYQGDVSGRFDLNGSIAGLAITGRLTSSGIGFGQGYYDQMEILFQGRYPHVYIQNSTIVRDDGLTLAIQGPFNLGSQSTYRSQIRALQIVPLVRDDSQKLEWTLRSLKTQGQGRTELNYMRRRGDPKVFSTDEDQGVIGIQRKLEF